MAGEAYFVLLLIFIAQIVLGAITTTKNPIFQNFEDELNDQEKFLKADLKLIKTTITSKLLGFLLNGFSSVENNISKSYNESVPGNTTGYNLQCIQNVNSSIDLDFEIYYSQIKFSGCENFTQSYDKGLEVMKNTTALSEELGNLTNIIMKEVELACQNKTSYYNTLVCLGENTKTFKERYNELYQRILSENSVANGEQLLLTLDNKKCLKSIFEEINLFVADMNKQFEECKN